jgi:lysophospholipase L1-like esterase
MTEIKDILFIGSSIVLGQLGVDWISQLPKKAGFRFLNCGINGAQVPTVINYVKDCNRATKPHAVVIMVGGNDVTNSIPLKAYGGFDQQRHGRPRSTPELYEQEVEELLGLIESKWGKIPIGMFSLKPHSDVVDGNLNRVVRQYNERLLNVVQSKGPHITYLDIYTPMIAAIVASGHVAKPEADDIEYVVDVPRMVYVLIMRYATFGAYTLNDYSDARGFYLFCDGLHFNERAADIVLTVIRPFMDQLAEEASS